MALARQLSQPRGSYLCVAGCHTTRCRCRPLLPSCRNPAAASGRCGAFTPGESRTAAGMAALVCSARIAAAGRIYCLASINSGSPLAMITTPAALHCSHGPVWRTMLAVNRERSQLGSAAQGAPVFGYSLHWPSSGESACFGWHDMPAALLAVGGSSSGGGGSGEQPLLSGPLWLGPLHSVSHLRQAHSEAEARGWLEAEAATSGSAAPGSGTSAVQQPGTRKGGVGSLRQLLGLMLEEAEAEAAAATLPQTGDLQTAAQQEQQCEQGQQGGRSPWLRFLRMNDVGRAGALTGPPSRDALAAELHRRCVTACPRPVTQPVCYPLPAAACTHMQLIPPVPPAFLPAEATWQRAPTSSLERSRPPPQCARRWRQQCRSASAAGGRRKTEPRMCAPRLLPPSALQCHITLLRMNFLFGVKKRYTAAACRSDLRCSCSPLPPAASCCALCSCCTASSASCFSASSSSPSSSSCCGCWGCCCCCG